MSVYTSAKTVIRTVCGNSKGFELLNRTLATLSAKSQLKTSTSMAELGDVRPRPSRRPPSATVYDDQTGWLPHCRSSSPQTRCVATGASMMQVELHLLGSVRLGDGVSSVGTGGLYRSSGPTTRGRICSLQSSG